MARRATLMGVLLGALASVAAACRPPPTAVATGASSRVESRASVDAVPRAAALFEGLPPTLSEPLPGDAMDVTVHRLSNGLTVFISPHDYEPRVQAWIVVRAGSRHDPPTSTGLAHYLEHMLFKGTDELGTSDMGHEHAYLERIAGLYAKLSNVVTDSEREKLLKSIDELTAKSGRYAIPNEIDRLYTSLGIRGFNAHTGDEETVYTADVPANRFQAWALVEGERFSDAVFRLFHPELEAVYEEKNLSLDSADDRLLEALLAKLFPGHPYGTQPTLGLVEHLKTPAYHDMVAYFRRWYVPNNMAIVLAGAVDREDALAQLEHTFGRLEPGVLPRLESHQPAAVAGRAFVEVEAEEEEMVAIAWPTVGAGHPDQVALEVMDWLVDNARTGLLNLELELTQKVPDAYSWRGVYNEAGYWAVAATARQGQGLAEVERLLLGVVGRLSSGAFTQKDIDAIILQQRIDRQLQLESNSGRAAKMANAYTSRRSWAEMLQRDRALAKVTRKDVLDVARRYLGDSRVVAFRRKGTPNIPRMAKPAITPVDLDSTKKSRFAAEVESMAAADVEPRWVEEGRDYRRGRLPSGPLLAVTNPRNDLFSVSYRFQWGYRDDPLLCHALDLFELSGVGAVSAEDLRRRLFALGTTVTIGCNAELVEVAVSGVDANMDESLDLLREWLGSPSYPPETVRALLGNTLSRRRDHLDSPRVLSRALSDFANFGRNSAWRQQPSNQALARAGGDELMRRVKDLPRRSHRTLYFGPRQAMDTLEGLALGIANIESRPARPRRYRPIESTTVWFLNKEVAKSEIEVLFPGAVLARERQPLAELYSEYLGGDMSALIPQELREARGLAYSASGYFTVGRTRRDHAGLLGRIATQSDKTVDALQLFLDLVQNPAVDPGRADAARQALDQAFRSARVDPRGIGAAVDAWELLDELQDPRPRLWAGIRAATIGDLQAFATVAADGAAIVSVLGDEDYVDLKRLAIVGPVIPVDVRDLFSYGSFPPQEVDAQGQDAASGGSP